MALQLPPMPRRADPLDGGRFSKIWDQWFQQVAAMFATGSIPWTSIDLSGSSHEELGTFQGGSSGQHYHLTAAEHNELQRGDNVASVSADTTLTDSHRTVLVSASAKTITLPAASASRIGLDWTVALGVDGYVTVTTQGGDAILTEDDDTSLVLDEKGACVTLRCLTATSWVLA